MSRPIVKSRSNGRVSNDGNGMIGGRWANTTCLAHKEVWLCDIMGNISESDEDKANKVYEWLKDHIGDPIQLEAYFDVGYDESVGLSSYCDLDEAFLPDGLEDAINECPLLTEEEKEVLMEKVQEVADDEDKYELYEIDYPEE